ncbi:hypothetical protein NN561_009008 [Cricetulus griseus]
MTGPGGAAGRRRRGGGADTRRVRLLVKASEGRATETLLFSWPRPCLLGCLLAGFVFTVGAAGVGVSCAVLGRGGSDDVGPDSVAPQGVAAHD